MKRLYTIVIILLLLQISEKTFSQEQPVFEKTIYSDTDGNLYWNKALPAYLWLSTSPDSEKIRLESKVHEKYVNPFYFDTEGPNFVRTRWAVDKKSKNTIYPKIELLFPVLVDSRSPISRINLEKYKPFFKNKKTFYGTTMDLDITSTDALSGVKGIYISINGGEFSRMNSISLNHEGDYVIKYFAVDNVGNVEKVRTKKFTIDIQAPQTFHTIVGVSLKDNVISLGTKIYLKTEDNLTGIRKTYYKIDGKRETLYNGRELPIKTLGNGEHTVTYYSVDNVGNKEKETTLNFYLDRLAPILTSDVLGDRYIVDNKIYFSGRTKLKLTAIDNKSGLKETRYSVNSSKYKKYTDPFYLPNKQGLHIIKYYAVDNTENNTQDNTDGYNQQYKHKVERIYVDLTGPSIKHSYIGTTFRTRDTIFISERTKIKLSAIDRESGLQYISYSIDRTQEETRYTKPFSVSLNGIHTLEYFAYDNVNNRNKKQMIVVADNKAPAIEWRFSIKPIAAEENLDVYPKYVKLYLSATDEVIGTKDIFYSINGKPFLKYITAITKFPQGKNVIKIKATDNLDNETVSETQFFIQ